MFVPFRAATAFFLALTMVLTACGADRTAPQSSPQAPEASSAQGAESPSGDTQFPQVLIAYFSLWENADWGAYADANSSASVVVEDGRSTGTTAYIAELIQAAVGGELYPITISEPYPADFDAVVDQNHQKTEPPPLAGTVPDLSQYDVVFLGYPIWAGTIPGAIEAFLAACDLSGKTIVPFCTHDGYGAGSSFADIAALEPNADVVRSGFAMDSAEAGDARVQVSVWLEGMHTLQMDFWQQTAVTVTAGDLTWDGVLYNAPEAQQFISQLPQTIPMTNYGGREVYGGIAQEIAAEGEGRLSFSDGDITYCPANNTVAIFYSQSDRPDLTMEVYPIGRITSDLSAFPTLESPIEITFSIPAH